MKEECLNCHKELDCTQSIEGCNQVEPPAIDVMIDLETMGTSDDCVICTIGAAAFNINTGEIIGTLYMRVHWEDGEQPLRCLDPETVAWWEEQPEEAKIELYHPERISLGVALVKLQDFIFKGSYVWSNGISFDLAILKHAFAEYSLLAPWVFYREMDCRTIERRAKDAFSRKDVINDGRKHHALDDAVYQVKYISAMWKATQPRT